MKQHKGGILIIDFGSQYSQLIARRIRELKVYAEIIPYHTSVASIKEKEPKGLILSGGPASVYQEDALVPDVEILSLNIPILGICYGMQIITHLLGGKIEHAHKKEFGKAHLKIDNPNSALFSGVDSPTTVWMSHADKLTKLPKGFKQIAHTDSSVAAITDNNGIYAVQFHPEVTHSTQGTQILKNFVFKICHCPENWILSDFIEEKIEEIRQTVGNKKVILALSGGVDSSVAAVLIQRAIGDQLYCIFVDTGLLRKNEGKRVFETYERDFQINIKMVAAQNTFLSALEGISDPEEKRKTIGRLFIETFDRESEKIPKASFLAQGTIYPDVIESQYVKGVSHAIKSHHNVGGLPEDISFELLEPLKELFKDEVRAVGRQLGLPETTIDRHPFPGPGLGIRILGEITPKKVEILQNADAIFVEELRKHDLYRKVNQAFVVLLPVKSVGVMGDVRTYEYTAVIRSANTLDFMTATWSRLPYDFLELVSNRIINEVQGINRVTYDISSKPPATIEWE